MVDTKGLFCDVNTSANHEANRLLLIKADRVIYTSATQRSDQQYIKLTAIRLCQVAKATKNNPVSTTFECINSRK